MPRIEYVVYLETSACSIPRSARPTVIESSIKKANSASDAKNEFSARFRFLVVTNRVGTAKMSSNAPTASAGPGHEDSELPIKVRKKRRKDSGPAARSPERLAAVWA